MAVASYATDLATLALGSIGVDAGTWDESSNAAWDDAGAMVDDGNLQYNGSKCVSAQFTKDGVGTIIYGHTSSVSIPTDGALLIHHLWAAPPALATRALGGVRILIGNGFGVFFGKNASGSDYAPAPSGGWYQYAYDPSVGADYTVGSPASPYSYFGMAVSATQQARGNPNAVNAIRYGRCNAIYTNGDITNGYAELAGFAILDNAVNSKWGLLKIVEGGYKQQGLMSLGTAATPVDFRDSNKSIIIENTINVSANFNRCEVVNASSRVDWTAFSIRALGTVSKYRFEVIDSAAIVNKESCTFEDLDTFKYGSGSTILNTTHRRCEPVSQLGATMTGGTIDKPFNTVGMIVSNLSLITKYAFNSTGTGYAVNLGTIDVSGGDVSVTWDNTHSGYGSSQTTNATVLVNVTGGGTNKLIINVTDTATPPTVNNTGTNGASDVSIVSGQKTLTFTGMPDGVEVRIRQGSYSIFYVASATGGIEEYSYTYTGNQLVTLSVGGSGYVRDTRSYTLKNADAEVSFELEPDPSYIP